MMKKEINIKNNCIGYLSEEIIDTILKTRNIKDIDEFLNPTVSNLLPFSDLYRIEEAADIVREGVQKGKQFCVFADV